MVTHVAQGGIYREEKKRLTY